MTLNTFVFLWWDLCLAAVGRRQLPERFSDDLLREIKEIFTIDIACARSCEVFDELEIEDWVKKLGPSLSEDQCRTCSLIFCVLLERLEDLVQI